MLDIYFDDWQPKPKTAAMLDRAWTLVNSVPYQVSARWVFYRLLQEGYYSKKSDYKNKWIKASSRARKTFYEGWRPDTLSDETRERIERGQGYDDAEDWIARLSRGINCHLDKWIGQDYYVELWYEARAMSDQFRHYTDYITLVPMAGQPSIPYKWQIAKDLERADENYDVPIIILYFGDLDPAGETISDVVEREVREWSAADFEFIRCGLTLEQVQQYNVPENPDKPGEYQWEALPDEGARAIIKSYVDQYVRHGAFTKIGDQERKAEQFLSGELDGLLERWRDDKR